MGAALVADVPRRPHLLLPLRSQSARMNYSSAAKTAVSGSAPRYHAGQPKVWPQHRAALPLPPRRSRCASAASGGRRHKADRLFSARLRRAKEGFLAGCSRECRRESTQASVKALRIRFLLSAIHPRHCHGPIASRRSSGAGEGGRPFCGAVRRPRSTRSRCKGGDRTAKDPTGQTERSAAELAAAIVASRGAEWSGVQAGRGLEPFCWSPT